MPALYNINFKKTIEKIIFSRQIGVNIVSYDDDSPPEPAFFELEENGIV